MENDMKDRIDFYLDAFEVIKQKVGDAGIAATLVEQIGKDLRVQAMAANGNSFARNSGWKSAPVHGDEPATTGQLGYLRSLGVNVPAGLNKRNASELIDQALAGR